ncbi:unnamed protein product [Caenorhabditis angaria]|uniref:THAP-type domain-containing protein n=1 Tax=Caenorhabditis angaria TaxID=860376 RepID=A0A9P1IZN7_9PELO|nr:unnamed protein product [Caenorhabditis angaria]
MTKVPCARTTREKWAKILGSKFAENVKKCSDKKLNDFGRICSSHFQGGQRIQRGQLPMKDCQKQSVSQPTLKNYSRKCCYCEKSQVDDQLTRVPTKESDREKWIERLGPRFAENLGKCKYGAICISHFNGFVRRRRNQLPIRMEEEAEKENEEDQEEQENEEEHEMEVEQSDENEEEDGMEQEVAEKQEEQQEEQNRTEGFIENENRVEEIQETGSVTVKREVPEIVENEQVEENRVEEIQETRSLRVKREQPEIVENEQVAENRVEKIQETRSLRVKREVPEIVENEQVAENRVEKIQETRSLRVKREQPEIVEIINNHICRYCEAGLNSSIKSIGIPTNTEEFIKWSKVFGRKFSNNVLRNPKPHFICVSHVFEKNWENV